MYVGSLGPSPIIRHSFVLSSSYKPAITIHVVHPVAMCVSPSLFSLTLRHYSASTLVDAAWLSPVGTPGVTPTGSSTPGAGSETSITYTYHIQTNSGYPRRKGLYFPNGWGGAKFPEGRGRRSTIPRSATLLAGRHPNPCRDANETTYVVTELFVLWLS